MFDIFFTPPSQAHWQSAHTSFTYSKDQPQEVKGQQNENGIPKANAWQVPRVWTC
jgi:hypothetical protein